MKKLMILAIAMLMGMTVQAQGQHEVTIKTVGTWTCIPDSASYKNLAENAKFNSMFFEFAENGTLTITRYAGEALSLKKTEQKYQYRFDSDKLLLTDDNGVSKSVAYTLMYDSMMGKKQMELDMCDGQYTLYTDDESIDSKKKMDYLCEFSKKGK